MSRIDEALVAEAWTISGRVQGVGYRDWMVREARRHGVAGWVRNRGARTVEALVQGCPEAVARLHHSCLHGPPLAAVASIERVAADAPALSHFERRASC